VSTFATLGKSCKSGAERLAEGRAPGLARYGVVEVVCEVAGVTANARQQMAAANQRWSTIPVEGLIDRLVPDCAGDGAIAIVGIDGRSRSGKSTLAELVAHAAPEVAIVHTDDIAWHHSFFGWSEVLIANVLRPLRHSGAPLSYIPAPWTKRGRQGSIDVPAHARVVLVEGVGAARLELREWLDASIWVQTDPAEAMRRTVALDRDPPGFVDDWMREENAHLDADQPWTRANVVVSGEHPIGDSVHAQFRNRRSKT
jgi:hypothetical protein